jgi:hypothetical protein
VENDQKKGLTASMRELLLERDPELLEKIDSVVSRVNKFNIPSVKKENKSDGNANSSNSLASNTDSK